MSRNTCGAHESYHAVVCKTALLLFSAAYVVSAIELDSLEEYYQASAWSSQQRRQTLEEARMERLNLRRLQDRFARHPFDSSAAVQWQREQRHDDESFFDAARFRRTRLMHEQQQTTSDGGCTLPDRCAPHGECMQDLGCSCFNSPSQGYWKGSTCDECVFGYAGANCTLECAGGSCNPCNSNGQCSQGTSGDGTCTCFSDASRGFWGGADCSVCAENYYGPACKLTCPGVDVGLVCGGNGACVDGLCNCTAGYSKELQCIDCDAGHFGPGCLGQCVGYVASTGAPCSGHGVCSNGTSGSGKCTACDKGWAGKSCSEQCPNGGNCGLNGTCFDGLAGNATCSCFGNLAPPNCSTCLATFTGPFCNVSCLTARDTSVSLEICSGNGVCFLDQGVAACRCATGYGGRFCQQPCGGDPPCSGHGNCGASGCECDANWSGPICESCAAAFVNSPFCSARCPLGTGGNVCSNEPCANGTCFCSDNVRCGSACNVFECDYCDAVFKYGPSCQLCPGVGPPEAVTSGAYTYACNKNGFCSRGRGGSGLCTCKFGYAGSACEFTCPFLPGRTTADFACGGPARGQCVANNNAAKCECADGFAGVSCELVCPRFEGAICAGQGTCDSITGRCVCNPEWTGVACAVPCMCNPDHGACNATACASLLSTEFCTACSCEGNFTDLCYSCRNGTQGEFCEGQCVHGTTEGQICICEDYYGTESCSVMCPFGGVNNTIPCSGHGVCSQTRFGDGKCHCNTTGYFGPNCGTLCFIDECKRLLINGQCNEQTGACGCQDDVSGHWQLGATGQCDTCMVGYWGPVCNEACACNDHGTCTQNAGECICFADSSRGFFSGAACESCAVGYIGASCKTSSVLLSEVSTSVLGNASFFPPPQAVTSNVAPRTPVLMVDDSSSFRSLYVGGLPVVMLDASNASAGLTVVGASNVNVSTVNKEFGCNTESQYVWHDISHLFFLQQPGNSSCPTVRIVYAPRPLRGAVSWGDTKVLWTPASVMGSSVRVRASTSQSNTGSVNDTKLYRSSGNIIAFVACNSSFSQATGETIWSSGCVLFVLELSTNFPASPTERSVQLPGNFFVTDIALSPATTQQQQIGISGYYVTSTPAGRTWEVLRISFTSNAASDTSSLVALSSVNSACWPKTLPDVETTNYSALANSCSYCVAAMKLLFIDQESMVIAMIARSEEDDVDDTIVVWFGPKSAMNCSTNYGAMPSRSDSGRSSPTAVVYDSFTKSIFLTVQMANGSPSQLSKFLLTSGVPPLLLNSIHTFSSLFSDVTSTKPLIIASLAIAYRSRLLYASTTFLTQVRVATFLLYEVTSITPHVASTAGTSITLVGRGFLHPVVGGGDPTCFFAGDATSASLTTRARILDATAAECPVAVGTDTSSCTLQVVELSLFNPTFGATSNLLAIQRTKVPTLMSVFPERGTTINPQKITLTGVDFINSPFATCRFSRLFSGENTLFVYVNASFVTPSTMTCIQPVVPRTNFTLLDLSLDRQVYSNAVRYVIVGPPTGIKPLNSSVTVRAADDVIQFSVTVVTVDDTGNPLGDLDTDQRRIVASVDVKDETTCTISDFDQWRRISDGYPYPVCREMLLNNQSRTATAPSAVPARFSAPNTTYQRLVAFSTTSRLGNATFNDTLFLFTPRVGTITLPVVAADSGWKTTVSVVVVSGEPYALMIKNLGQFEGSSRMTIPSKAGLPLPDINIIVIDKYANVIVPDSVSNLEVTAHVVFFPDNCSYTPPSSTFVFPSDCLGDEGTFSSRYSRSFSAVPFKDRIVLSGSVNGANHFIAFNATSTALQLIPVVSPFIRTALCSNDEYKVPLSTVCAPCPVDGGHCDGTEVIRVKPGYWRADNVSTRIYPCQKLSPACNGTDSIRGSECTVGSTGPLCGVCATYAKVSESDASVVVYEYWGRSKLTDCTLCYGQAANDALFGVVAVVVFVIVVIWSFCTLRTEGTTDVSVVLRTVVNHLQSTGEVGQLSSKVGPLVKGLFSVSNGASTISVRALQFFECFQKQHNLVFGYFFYGIMCLPVLAVPVACSVVGIIRLMRLTPLLSPELRREIDLQLKQLGPNGAFVSLKYRYPVFMVFTTTFSVVIFTVYQTLISQSTSVLLCQEYVVSEPYLSSAPYKTKWFLADDLAIECSSNGVSPYFLAGQIFAIGYGFGIPLTFIFGYRFMNGRLGMPALTNFIFLFLCGGYKTKFWFWQALIMIRKLLLVLVRVFINDERVQNAAAMWIMSVALALQLWLKPAEKPEHNTVEAVSLSVITLTLNLSLIYYWPNLGDASSTAITVFLIIITVGGFITIAVFLIKPAYRLVQEISQDIRSVVAGLKQQEEEARQRRRRAKQRRAMLTHRFDPSVIEDDDTELRDVTTRRGALTKHKTVHSGGSAGISIDYEFEEADVNSVSLLDTVGFQEEDDDYYEYKQ